MSIRYLGGAIVGLGLLAGCGDTGTNPTDETRYFPLSAGNTWTYAPSDPVFGEAFLWQVTARNRDTVTLVRPSQASHPGPVTLLDRAEGVDLLGASTAGEPLYRFTQGSEWVRHEPWECDDGSEWTAVAEPNPITTPAGTFHNTLRLERRSAANCADAGTMMEWWARGVGLIRWEELNYYAGGPLTYELIGYSVD